LRKHINSILVLFLTIIICIAIYTCPTPIATLSYWGSRGDEVTNIQVLLRRWGYYKGWVDGIYGNYTFQAVKWFQANNGLTADGVAGPETLTALGLAALPAPTTTNNSSVSRNVNLLAHLVYGEARGEPYVGQVAVAAVVLNRMQDSRFPKSIASIIYQPGAFTAVDDGQINLDPDNDAYNAARDALNGWDPSGGCIYYFNPATATSRWIWSRPLVVVIGRHYFTR
jgi:N-acetylmuramoyl-L-alanine amidase